MSKVVLSTMYIRVHREEVAHNIIKIGYKTGFKSKYKECFKPLNK